MTKLPAVKPRQVVRFLEENEFVLDHTSGSHFIFYHPTSHRRRWRQVTIATCRKTLSCHC
jgi:predicted RNA binding protein YcfA (HicA-like mRNA interferase family)